MARRPERTSYGDTLREPGSVVDGLVVEARYEHLWAVTAKCDRFLREKGHRRFYYTTDGNWCLDFDEATLLTNQRDAEELARKLARDNASYARFADVIREARRNPAGVFPEEVIEWSPTHDEPRRRDAR